MFLVMNILLNLRLGLRILLLLIHLLYASGKTKAALIGAIQNSTPEYTNAAAILTDKLNIGREAAYRRLRGEVPFTFGEAGVLSAQMNFSLDRTVGALDFGNVLFRLSFSDYHTALEDYTGVIDQDTLFYREVSSDVDAEQAIAGNSFPRMLYMRYPKLTNFKLFKWLYQQGLIDCSGAKFEDMKVPEVLLQSYRDLVHEAQQMPSTTLVFDGSCTKRWVNAICAFRNMHLITDESVEVRKPSCCRCSTNWKRLVSPGSSAAGSRCRSIFRIWISKRLIATFRHGITEGAASRRSRSTRCAAPIRTCSSTPNAGCWP